MNLRPQRKNANKHSEHGLRLLEKSLQQDGWIDAQTIAADGEMISGSARLEVAGEKFADVEPIIIESDGTRPVIVKRTDIPNADDPRAKRLSVAANQIAYTDWNPDGDLLKEWGNEDKDIRAMFADSEWEEVTGEEKPSKDAEPQIDRAAELQEKWKTATGQLWKLGDHRLLIGDCTVRENVERLMGGERAGACVTDPPYGIGYEYDTHDDSDNTKNERLVISAFSFAPDCRVWTCGLMNTARELSHYPDAKILCWHKGFAQAGSGLGGASTWEPVLVVNSKKATLPNDYLDFSTDREKGLRDLHSCPKPVKLFEHLIKHLTDGIIYEPFGGSGTTIIAAHNLNRRCYAMEISPNYGAVILERVAQAFPELEIKRVE